MACLYWRGRMNLWEGDWARLWFHLLWERDMNLSLYSLSFVGLACASYLAPAVRLIQFPCESVRFRDLAENTSRRKGSFHPVGFSSWVGSTKAQTRAEVVQRRGQDLVLCNLMFANFVILWTAKLQISHSKRHISLQIKWCFPELLGSMVHAFPFLLNVQKSWSPWERIAKSLTVPWL